jgi:hypothetical protein
VGVSRVVVYTDGLSSSVNNNLTRAILLLSTSLSVSFFLYDLPLALFIYCNTWSKPNKMQKQHANGKEQEKKKNATIGPWYCHDETRVSCRKPQAQIRYIKGRSGRARATMGLLVDARLGIAGRVGRQGLGVEDLDRRRRGLFPHRDDGRRSEADECEQLSKSGANGNVNSDALKKS